MSGTSLDGIDVAFLKTDGEYIDRKGPFHFYPYSSAFQKQLKSILGAYERTALITSIEEELTFLHSQAVKDFLSRYSVACDVIGFHGQTITHAPEKKFTWQLGNSARLAQDTGIAVVGDFRIQDVLKGGQGAPLVPVYHQALAKDLAKPIAIVNIGGVANVTWIGEENILAFDTGPGNALINDWVFQHTGQLFDEGGALASQGTPHSLDKWLSHPYFKTLPPKSLDRNMFKLPFGLSLEDGAATLTLLTATTISQSQRFFPAPAQEWILAGGGRHNKTLVKMLRQKLPHVTLIDTYGWSGDALEAEAFAFLGVRHLKNLPLTFPTTTGAPYPLQGGTLYSDKAC